MAIISKKVEDKAATENRAKAVGTDNRISDERIAAIVEQCFPRNTLPMFCRPLYEGAALRQWQEKQRACPLRTYKYDNPSTQITTWVIRVETSEKTFAEIIVEKMVDEDRIELDTIMKKFDKEERREQLQKFFDDRCFCEREATPEEIAAIQAIRNKPLEEYEKEIEQEREAIKMAKWRSKQSGSIEPLDLSDL